MKSKSRQGRIEATERANRIKSSTHPAFTTREHGEWKPGVTAGYFSCQVLGYEVKLRFGDVWAAYCPHFKSEIQFTNRTDEAMIIFLSDWLTALIERPQAPAAQLRQATPAVLYLAEYYDIATFLADEIMRGR